MTTRLSIYNDALLICGERKISSLTENREARYLLDDVWDNNGVDKCLSRGQWRFAMRSVMIDYDPDITPEFGYQRAFLKPSDWVATSAVCEDEYFNAPLLHYWDEAGYWYSDLDVIYVRYVSNDAAYGGDLSLWPPSFAYYVAGHFAAKIILKLTQDVQKRNDVLAYEKQLLGEAKNHDAMADPQRFPAPGNWASARGIGRKRDRGSRSSLIG